MKTNNIMSHADDEMTKIYKKQTLDICGNHLFRSKEMEKRYRRMKENSFFPLKTKVHCMDTAIITSNEIRDIVLSDPILLS